MSNNFNFNKIKWINFQYNNGYILRRYINTGFELQNTITNNIIMGIRTLVGVFNFNCGNGYFKNYSDENGNLLSDNRRYFANAIFRANPIKKYTIVLSEKYSVNNGLTMHYVPISYSESIDTQSYYENRKDIDLGISMSRSYEDLGIVKSGINYIYNYRAIPDSIPVNAKSYRAYIGAQRKFGKFLVFDVQMTGEKRKGTDPEIERENKDICVYIITPSISVSYIYGGIGNMNVIYSTSFYSGDSEQRRDEIGFDVNMNFDRFNIYGGGNYVKAKYYTTLEYKIGIKLFME